MNNGVWWPNLSFRVVDGWDPMLLSSMVMDTNFRTNITKIFFSKKKEDILKIIEMLCVFSGY